MCLQTVDDKKKSHLTVTAAVCLQKVQGKLNRLTFTLAVCLRTVEAKKKNLLTDLHLLCVFRKQRIKQTF